MKKILFLALMVTWLSLPAQNVDKAFTSSKMSVLMDVDCGDYISYDIKGKVATLHGNLTVARVYKDFITVKIKGVKEFIIDPTFPSLYGIYIDMRPEYRFALIKEQWYFQLFGKWTVGEFIEVVKTTEFDYEDFLVIPTKETACKQLKYKIMTHKFFKENWFVLIGL